jgi:hypothetical protein
VRIRTIAAAIGAFAACGLTVYAGLLAVAVSDNSRPSKLLALGALLSLTLLGGGLAGRLAGRWAPALCLAAMASAFATFLQVGPWEMIALLDTAPTVDLLTYGTTVLCATVASAIASRSVSKVTAVARRRNLNGQ